MKILLAPLNWGLGHASRCVPVVRRLLDEGHEVVLGGDGDSLTLLRKHFPKLRYVYLSPLRLRYSPGRRQVWAMLKAIPQLLRWAVQDHVMLKAVLREEPFDRVISDNRFGLYLNHKSQTANRKCECIYITHQLHIRLPLGWRWAEPLAARLHARIYTRFTKVWVPDFAERGSALAGLLSHPSSLPLPSAAIEYIGPLSRFTQSVEPSSQPAETYDVVAVLSGLEPHRTMLEQQIVNRFLGSDKRVLIVQGLVSKPLLRVTHKNITLLPYMSDAELASSLRSASWVIARSGYSTIMDFAALGLLRTPSSALPAQSSAPRPQLELVPTPGQPEQEYLAERWSR